MSNDDVIMLKLVRTATGPSASQSSAVHTFSSLTKEFRRDSLFLHSGTGEAEHKVDAGGRK